MPGIGAPGRRISAPEPNGGATIGRREAPATASDAPGSGNSAPAASSAAPARNGGGVCRGKAPFQAEKRPLEAKSVELGGRTSSSRASGVMAEIGAQALRGALVRHLGRQFQTRR